MKKFFSVSIFLFTLIIFNTIKLNGWPAKNTDKNNDSELLSKTNSDSAYPSVEIQNNEVKMKLYLPDIQNGYYRGTRFDWSGIISSFTFQGHEFFGEWSKTRNPLNSSDITGPVNGYLLPGLGYETANAGDEFIRIGIGALMKENEDNYQPFKTYNFIDNGEWSTKSGNDWIEFIHKLNSISGWGYIYKKRIELTSDMPGFKMSYYLENTGDKLIETDQFNHNFFVIDNTAPGTDFYIEFPFRCSTENNRQLLNSPVVTVENNRLVFQKAVTDRDVWIKLGGFGHNISDNRFVIKNTKAGAEITVSGNIPLYDLIFWANKKALSPETFIYLKIPPGQVMKWEFLYTVNVAK
jgi:hypothetical protein